MKDFLIVCLSALSPLLFLCSICSALVGVATIIGWFLKIIGKNEEFPKWYYYLDLFSSIWWVCYLIDVKCHIIINILAAIAMVKCLIEIIIEEIIKYRNKKRTN